MRHPPLLVLSVVLLSALGCTAAPTATSAPPVTGTAPPVASPTRALPTPTTPASVATETPILPTPEAVVNFSVDALTVSGQECTTLRWSAANVQEVRLYGGEYGSAPGQGMAGEGSTPACPPAGNTVTYVLRAVDRAGNVIERTVTVQNTTSAVQPPQVSNTAVFGAAAGLIWNFIPLDEGILQLQVQADPNAFTEQPTPVTSDGEGIQRVEFVVSKAGEVVYTRTENNVGYCLLGGDGPCDSLVFEDGVYKWEQGGRAVESGDYSVAITITLTDGATRELFASFSIQLP